MNSVNKVILISRVGFWFSVDRADSCEASLHHKLPEHYRTLDPFDADSIVVAVVDRPADD